MMKLAAVIGVFAIIAAGMLAACNPGHKIAFSCPPGAQMRGAPPPRSDEIWCQKTVNGRPVKDGPFVVFNDNGGKMIEGNYVDGKQDGVWTMRYLNGQREAIDHYRDGVQNGLHISWYANGVKAIEGEYRDGKREGVWTRWDPNGLRAIKERYRDGEKVP